MPRLLPCLLVLLTTLSCQKVPPIIGPLHFPGTYIIERQTVVNANGETTFTPPTIFGNLVLTETRFTFDVTIASLNSREFSEGTYTTVGNVIILNITGSESSQPPPPEQTPGPVTVSEQIIELSEDSQRITVTSTLTSGNATARSIMVFVRVS